MSEHINKPKLKPAEENPWYVLATICGEEPVRYLSNIALYKWHHKKSEQAK